MAVVSAIRLMGVLALCGVVRAQSSVVSIFLLDTDEQPLVASVVSVDSATTTYLVNCAPGTDSSDCGTYDNMVTVADGYVENFQSEGDFTFSYQCSLDGTTSARCTESDVVSTATGFSVEQLPATDITFFPVTITAGLEKLSGGAGGSAAATATPTGSGSAASGGSASQTTANILFPGVEPSQLALSVVSAGPSTTIYQLGCPLDNSGVPLNDSCPFTEGLQPWITQASNFWGQNFTVGEFQTATASCSVSRTSSVDCTFTNQGRDEDSTTTVNGTPTTIRGSSESDASSLRTVFSYGAATVTAGAEKLQSGSGSGSLSITGSGSGESPGGTGVGSSPDSGSASSSSSGNAAGPRETGAMGLLAAAGIIGAGFML